MEKYALCTLMVGLGLAPIGRFASARAPLGRPAVLYNPSPSEPPGLYWLSTLPPAPGRVIAFHVPQKGRAYASTHLRYVMRNAILKEIAAGEGAVVCDRDGIVSIDGQVRGWVAPTDRHGVPLPHWTGCQRLQKGQYFVLSNRIPNSFDSRYYGPVSQSEVIGVYRPFWTSP